MSKSKKVVKRVGFFSFIKLTLLYGLALGELVGIAFLICALYGLPVHLNLGLWTVRGVPAGIGSLFAIPVLFGIFSVIAAPLLFLPFTIACHFLGGFKVSPGN